MLKMNKINKINYKKSNLIRTKIVHLCGHKTLNKLYLFKVITKYL